MLATQEKVNLCRLHQLCHNVYASQAVHGADDITTDFFSVSVPLHFNTAGLSAQFYSINLSKEKYTHLVEKGLWKVLPELSGGQNGVHGRLDLAPQEVASPCQGRRILQTFSRQKFLRLFGAKKRGRNSAKKQVGLSGHDEARVDLGQAGGVDVGVRVFAPRIKQL